jgi:GT2 family glycosyltransferase
MKPVSVISLLNWDASRYLENLLANLDAFSPGGIYHLRILDQGSEPETKKLLKEYVTGKSHVSVEFLSKNIGYSAGHNYNFATVSKNLDFQYFVTINNDVLFGATDWLKMMVSAMEAYSSAAVGGPTCWKVYPTYIKPANRVQKEAGDYLFVGGSVAIIRVSAVRRFGLFDEVYTPAYWEDADLCLRYVHFGMRQIWIDVPFVHGYLGNAGSVNQEKHRELEAEYGDFRMRNERLLSDRWVTNRSKYPVEAQLSNEFPRLYIP